MLEDGRNGLRVAERGRRLPCLVQTLGRLFAEGAFGPQGVNGGHRRERERDRSLFISARQRRPEGRPRSTGPLRRGRLHVFACGPHGMPPRSDRLPEGVRPWARPRHEARGMQAVFSIRFHDISLREDYRCLLLPLN